MYMTQWLSKNTSVKWDTISSSVSVALNCEEMLAKHSTSILSLHWMACFAKEGSLFHGSPANVQGFYSQAFFFQMLPVLLIKTGAENDILVFHPV